MKYLITGGAGFIGSHLVENFANQGHEVVVIDNFCSGNSHNIPKNLSNITIIRDDVRSKSIRDAFSGVDVVFHLAALADIVPSINNPAEYIDVNVMGTVNVLESMRFSGVQRIIYAASSSCYGIPSNYPTSESTRLDPRYPYALSKLLGEQVFFHWLQVYGLSGLSLRLFNVYGRRARTSGRYGAMFGVFLSQFANGLPLTIVGSGEQKRDFTHVSDVVRAFILAGSSQVSGLPVNIGSELPQSVAKIANLIGGQVVNIPHRPGEPDLTFADASRAKSLLGWSAQLSLEEGIADLMNNLSEWKNAPIWTPEKIAVETQEWFRFLKDSE